MFTSLSEFRFFQKFRIPVEAKDNIQFILEVEDENFSYQSLDNVRLMDVSATGLGFSTGTRISEETPIRASFQFKRLRFDVEGKVVRSFCSHLNADEIIYGVELDEDEAVKMKRFISQYVNSFSPERAREGLSQIALTDRYNNDSEGFEIFSLMLSLFKDITKYGNQQSFLENMLQEVSRIMNAQRSSIFLINPETNELEANAAQGADKEVLKFDYRKGIAGSVFTTGVPLNIDTQTDKIRFSKDVDKMTGFQTTSIICHPITNREDKVIGVVEVLNKRNQTRFTVEDEKTMKVLSLIFSSVFHDYNPVSERSLIRRFSTPYDREFAFIGVSNTVNDLRKSIVKLKDLDSPILIKGEFGVGKKLMSRIIHNEGKRGLNAFKIIDCRQNPEEIRTQMFGNNEFCGYLEECAGGTVVFDEITALPLDFQAELYKILKDSHIPGSQISIDARAVFLSSKELSKLIVERGEFHFGLYDYLTTTILKIDPLRKRLQDIPHLVSYFLKKECSKQGLLLKEFSEDLLDEFMQHEWPHNVFELHKAVEKAVLYNPKAHIIEKRKSKALQLLDKTQSVLSGFDDIPLANDSDISLKERVALVEREMILDEIRRQGGNKSKAAKILGISREALRKKMLYSDEVLSVHEGEEAVVADKKAA